MRTYASFTVRGANIDRLVEQAILVAKMYATDHAHVAVESFEALPLVVAYGEVAPSFWEAKVQISVPVENAWFGK